jgi:hypothetical protein
LTSSRYVTIGDGTYDVQAEVTCPGVGRAVVDG